MKFGIRAKVLAILLVAGAAPLLLGIVSVAYMGYRDYQRNQGTLYRIEATNVADMLGHQAGAQIDQLADWIALANTPHAVLRLNRRHGHPSALQDGDATQLDSQWPKLPLNHNALQAVLDNQLARELRAFQTRHPLFHEIFVTGAQGRIVAATNKTSDFIQDDEPWWQRAIKLPPGRVWVQGIRYDESAQIHALEIELPLRVTPESAPVGVLKAVLNVSSLFTALPLSIYEPGVQRAVVLGNGRILALLGDKDYVPLQEQISKDVFTNMLVPRAREGDSDASREGGWFVAPAIATEKQQRSGHDLIGYAPLEIQADGLDEAAIAGLDPMTVLVYNDASKVLAPVRRHVWLQTGMGFSLLLVFLLVGWILVQRKIVEPLETLRAAAQSVATTALQEEAEVGASDGHSTRVAASELANQLESIHTHDEIEALAKDLETMALRVLSFNERLQRELHAKTGEIQRDLQMAREFQEALLPRGYPQVPAAGLTDAFTLQFCHVYQPAQSVGGDFFDVFKVSENRAGIFIADVMGHGARSALVTAILRTLLQDLATQVDDPARLLEMVNHHFYKIVRASDQFIFVSAFCLIVDVIDGSVAYASAGHPSPVRVDRERGAVEPLLEDDNLDPVHSNAALGLEGNSTYTSHRRAVQPGEVFLLFTDGVSEAPGPSGEDYGMERLCNLLRRYADRNVAGLCRLVTEDVQLWLSGVPSPDDICLVGVEIGPPLSATSATENQIPTPGSSEMPTGGWKVV